MKEYYITYRDIYTMKEKYTEKYMYTCIYIASKSDAYLMFRVNFGDEEPSRAQERYEIRRKRCGNAMRQTSSSDRFVTKFVI